MSTNPLEAGPPLDRRIAKRVLGRRHSADPPRYSTEEEATDALLARLGRQGVSATFEEDQGIWYCVLWAPRPGDEVKERIATGSAETRPLAACRGFLNLPLTGSGTTLALRTSDLGWIAAGPGDKPLAEGARGARRSESPLRAVPNSREEAPWLIPDDASVPGRVREG